MFMKIGAVSEQTGLSAHTIRYYEKLGLISKATKDSSGLRVYSNKGIELLNWIACLKKSGMSLSKINTYVAGYNEDNVDVVIKILEQHLEKLLIQQQDIAHYIDVTAKKINRLKSS